MFKNLCSDAYIDCVQFQAEQEARRMTARQLRDAVREMLPDTAYVHVVDEAATDEAIDMVYLTVVIDLRDIDTGSTVFKCGTAEQALAAFKANVDQLRGGDVSVKVGV